MMNETRRKPTTGRQSPSLFDKWHGIFYMPSRIEPTSAHTYESEIQRSTTYATPTPPVRVRPTCYAAWVSQVRERLREKEK